MWNWKNLALSFFYGIHAEQLLLGPQIEGDLILLYHNILPETERSFNVRNIGLRTFDRQLAYLKKRYPIVPLEAIYNEKSRVPRIAITFDDGLINNLELALPVLKHHGAPATFFIASPILHGRQLIWPDWLSMLGKSGCKQIVYEKMAYNHQSDGTFKNENKEKLSDKWRKLKPETIYDFLDAIERSFGDQWRFQPQLESHWRIMKGEEIKILAQDSLVEIGGHTALHPSLPCLTSEEQKEEIGTNKDYLEKCIGKSIQSFAFPFGDGDFGALKHCLDLGYTRILGVKSNGLNHPFLKSRFGIYNNESRAAILHQINRALHEKR